jgi:hypothetical protein
MRKQQQQQQQQQQQAKKTLLKTEDVERNSAETHKLKTGVRRSAKALTTVRSEALLGA